jgi:hypothetical protein
MAYYRIQTADRDVADLLDPSNWATAAWQTDDEQHGTSVCDSLEALAEYLATAGEGIPYGTGVWVIVELDGDRLPERGHDGEDLIEPHTIISVTPMGDEMFDLIGAAYDALAI